MADAARGDNGDKNHSVSMVLSPEEKMARRFRLVLRDLGDDSSVNVTGKSIRQLKRYAAGDEPPFGVLKRLAESSGASLDWITYGNTQSIKDHELAIEYGEQEISRLSTLKRSVIDERARDHLSSMISLEAQLIDLNRQRLLLEQNPNEVRRPTEMMTHMASDFIPIPRLDIRASAGNGRLALMDEEAQVVAFRHEWLRRLGVSSKNAVIIMAEGDSMEPTIKHGDLVLIDKSVDHVVDEGIYVLVLAGLVLLKRIQISPTGSIFLKSDNTAYDPFEIQPHDAPEIIIEGRVRWAGGAI